MDEGRLESASVARAAEGDTEELERLLREIEPELRRGVSIQPLWARSLEVEDVLQVSYLEAFLRIPSLEHRTTAGFRAWMRRIVENNLADAIRALERDKRPDPRRRTTRGSAGESSRTLLQALAGDQVAVSIRSSTAEQVAALQRAIAKLPPSYRTVVEEVDLAERSVAELATEMGRSVGAVHLLRSRAHGRLRELLGG